MFCYHQESKGHLHPNHPRGQDHPRPCHLGGWGYSLCNCLGYWDPEGLSGQITPKATWQSHVRPGGASHLTGKQLPKWLPLCLPDYLICQPGRAQRCVGGLLPGFVGAGPYIPLISLSPKTSLTEEQPAPAASPTPMPKQSPRPKRQHASPDPVDSKPSSKTMPQTALEEPHRSKMQEVPPWNKVLKQSHSEAFSWDSDLVKEVREEYFLKHCYSFILEGTCDHLEIFRQMATNAELLGTFIYEIQAVWTGPDELRQANYALRSLPKGLKFLHAVPPSESPKVMGLVGIHDLDDLHHFNDMTHCPWCGKEGQNEGTVVNHLWTVHYRQGLVCNKCNNCPSTSSDTLHCHGQQDCQQPGEKVTNELVSSE